MATPLHVSPCPSHVDLANPMLAVFEPSVRSRGRSTSLAIRDFDGVVSYDDTQPQFLLELIDEIGQSASDVLQLFRLIVESDQLIVEREVGGGQRSRGRSASEEPVDVLLNLGCRSHYRLFLAEVVHQDLD